MAPLRLIVNRVLPVEWKCPKTAHFLRLPGSERTGSLAGAGFDTPMRKTVWLAALIALAVPGAAAGQGHVLRFAKTIGPGWALDKSGWMSFVAFSTDGTRILSDAPSKPDDISGGLTIWSFPKGRLIARMPGQPQAVSRDWKFYAASDGVRDRATGRRLIAQAANTYALHAFSPDDAYVAQAQHDAPIRLISLENGKVVRTFGTHGAFSLAISPDGRMLAAGHWDSVMLWDIRSGRRIATLRGFGRYVESISFRRDGRVLAAGTDWGQVQAWTLRGRKRLFSIQIGGGDTSNPAFSPDGRLLAVGIYGTGTVWVLDAQDGKLLDQAKVSGIGCGSAAFSPDGRYLITPSTGGLVTWPYDLGGRIKVFEVLRRAADTRRVSRG
jgi:WD40 repeat protein